jgi:hypothetical protein
MASQPVDAKVAAMIKAGIPVVVVDATSNKPLIDRLANELESARDTMVDFARGTSNEYGSVGAALHIDKLLDEYREWRKSNPSKTI